VHVKATDKAGRFDEDYGVVAMPALSRARRAPTPSSRPSPKRSAALRCRSAAWAYRTKARSKIFHQSAKRLGSALNRGAPPHNPTTGEVLEADGDDPRIAFIEACRDHIRREIDVGALGAWWNSDEQKAARRDFELTAMK